MQPICLVVGLVCTDKSLIASLGKKPTIHQVTTMLAIATSQNVLFLGPNHLLTTSTDGPSLACGQVITKVSGHQYQWLTWLL